MPGNEMNGIDELVSLVSLAIVFHCHWSTTDGQQSINYENACCGRSIMESIGLVAMETQRSLTPGNYTALRAKFCSPDPVWIQLWRPADPQTTAPDLEMVLRWQIRTNSPPSSSSSSPSSESGTIQTVTFDGAPLTIDPTDRLGLFTPSNITAPLRYPIPYDTHPSFSLYFSRAPIDLSTDLQPGYHVTMDDLRWPRSFRNYLVFCTTATNCPPFGSDEGGIPMATTTVQPPRNTTSTPSCCNIKMELSISPDVSSDCASRDQLDELNRKLDNQTKTIEILQTTIEVLIQLVKNLTQQLPGTTPSSGTCRSGFTPGPTGVANCYLVYREMAQMGSAVLRCVDDYGANLVSIRTQAEENFLRTLISGYSAGASQPEEYWTTGMFNFPTRTWVWYDESSSTKTGFVYRKWYNNEEPAPVDENDVCMTLTYDPRSGQDYWMKRMCLTLAYFICQLPKICT